MNYQPVLDILGTDYKGMTSAEIHNSLSQNDYDLKIGVELLNTLILKNLSVGYVILYKSSFVNQYTDYKSLYMSWSDIQIGLEKKSKTQTDEFLYSKEGIVMKKLQFMTK